MHPVVTRASTLILSGEVAGAERALVEIAEVEGDQALVAVLDDISSGDLVSILREFDSSKESVVSLLVTPEQFARAIVEERKFGERTFERLHAMVDSVIHNHREMASEFLTTLVETHQGCDVLGDYFEDHIDEFFVFSIHGTFTLDHYPELPEGASLTHWLVRQTDGVERTFSDGPDGKAADPVLERTEIADGGWMETAWVLRYLVPEGFALVFNILHSRVMKRIEEAARAAQQVRRGPAAARIDDDDEESAI